MVQGSLASFQPSLVTLLSPACLQLRRSIEQNASLTAADMRQCGALQDDEFAAAEALRVRLEKRERVRVLTKGGAGAA